MTMPQRPPVFNGGYRASRSAAEREIERIEVRRKKLVESIMDGVPASEVRDELNANAVRREELKAKLFAADAPPQHVTFMGELAFVTSGDDAVLRVHALDGRLLRSRPVPAGSYNVQGSHDDPRARRWVLTPSLSAGTLCSFSPRGAPLDQLRVARSSHDACFLIGT